jgi:hypothetical protein
MTLIEVMLSIAILTVGMIILLAAASRCLAVARATRLYQDARLLLAQVELEEPLLPEEIESGSDRGRFSRPYENYSWQREITEVGEDEEDRLFQITTRIIWSERGRKAHEEVITYIYAPEEEDE